MSLPTSSLRSWPELYTFPAAARMTARSCLSSPMRPRQSSNSRMSASERAFRLAGRFSVTTATEPYLSKQRLSYPICRLLPRLSLVPAILREVLFVGGPLGELDAHLAEGMEVGVELQGDHALVLTVVVPEDIAPVRQGQRVDGPAVVEVERHADQQVGDRIDDALDRQGLSAASEGAVAALHQRRAFQPSHSAHASCGTAVGRLKMRCRPIVP